MLLATLVCYCSIPGIVVKKTKKKKNAVVVVTTPTQTL